MEKTIMNLRPIDKVLIANRGEIAVRIIRTLDKMGICSVAVFTDEDSDALHCKMASERHKLEGYQLAETYLNIEQIIRIAKKCGVNAIHPGYGFLSENPTFAKAVQDAGLVFIGPSEEAIRVMGNKKEAREIASKLHIPLAEGATGKPETLIKAAQKIGYPLMVKAAAGGGGKGMRIVHSAEHLPEVLEATQREAKRYFGNADIYIEKFLTEPRHIEVQLLADQHGSIVSLFERECSLQRRHQKIIEESPAPGISDKMRTNLMETAKKLASHIQYESAGTVEFLVDGDDYYFLEMNTRIQVEHPVTEMVTGLDIVKEQIHIATGRALPYKQEDIKINGHAIEARVYAEDPANNFLPAPGSIYLHQEPSGNGLRIDSSIGESGTISSKFDPMISKVVFHSASRETARKRIIQHLKNYLIIGVKTNISYLIKLLSHDLFINGNMHTNLVDAINETQSFPDKKPEYVKQLLAIAYMFVNPATNQKNTGTWQQIGHWRLMPGINVLIDGNAFNQNYTYHTATEMIIPGENKDIVFRLTGSSGNQMEIEANGTRHVLHFLMVNGEVFFQHEGISSTVRPVSYLGSDTLSAINENPVLEGETFVRAPMSGTVVKVMVKPGDNVNKGDTLLILESMKMENKISATARAFVKDVSIREGDSVSDNSPLIHLSSNAL